MVFFAGVFFILGALIASFVGVWVGRLSTGEAIVSGRSRCDVCGEPLNFLDLAPIVSWSFSRGRARCCGARVSFLGTLSEIVLGALFALAYRELGLDLALVFFLLALALILAIVLYDLRHQIIPSVFLLPFVGVALCFAWTLAPSWALFEPTLLISLLIGGFLLLLHLLSRGRWMGLADAPFAFALALLAGPAALAGFAYAFWTGAIIGIALLALPGSNATMKSEVPFAPFLALGFLLAFFIPWDPFLFITTFALGPQ